MKRIWMNILAVLLILIYAGAVAGPVTGVAMMYSDNPVEMIIPPEVQEIVTSTVDTEKPIELPQVVSSSYDPATQTVTAIFNFTNPLDVDLRINWLSADIECTSHAFALGHAQLSGPVEINKDATAMITVVFVWTQSAEAHFVTSHAGATTIDINLINLGIDVSGITIEAPESMTVNVPLSQ
jgi:hypothetical protein